jgi:hypothetical protein
MTVRYLVKPGDSMWRIAEIFYGSGVEWNKVAAANPGVSPGHILRELSSPVCPRRRCRRRDMTGAEWKLICATHNLLKLWRHPRS